MKKVFIFILFYSCLSYPQNNIKPTVIQPASPEQLAPIISWATHHKDLIEKHLGLSDLSNYEGYILDINNDGKQEYVFINHCGSLGVLVMYFFAKTESGIQILDQPQEFPDDYFDFFNPISNQRELFVKIHGKIYFCTSDDRITRSIYLWQNNKITFCCDSYWINEQRQLFNKLYEQKNYNNAYQFLYGFEKQCRHKIDPQTDLWLRNDIALALFKDGSPHSSLKILTSIKNDTAFAHASSSLIKAVENNMQLCLKILQDEELHGTKGKYNYNWLLTYNECELRQGDFNGLFATTIPDIEKPFSLDYYLYNFWPSIINPWKNDISNHFCGPADDDLQIIDNRYVFFSGFYPHSAYCRGFMWCDVHDKASIAAIGVSLDTPESLNIFSRNLYFKEAPSLFFELLMQWIIDNNIIPSEIIFYDHRGIATHIPTSVIDIDIIKQKVNAKNK